MNLANAQAEANLAKSKLIHICDGLDIKSKKDQKMHDELEKIIIKLEVWQNK